MKAENNKKKVADMPVVLQPAVNIAADAPIEAASPRPPPARAGTVFFKLILLVLRCAMENRAYCEVNTTGRASETIEFRNDGHLLFHPRKKSFLITIFIVIGNINRTNAIMTYGVLRKLLYKF